MARAQYAFALLGFLLMVGGLLGIHLINPATFEPFAVAGALLAFASLALFIWIIFATTRATAKETSNLEGLQTGIAG